ncbi:LysR family transcriptional regulator [Bordetella sp. 15P40C-2]|uniref:LysR family transcriptional regulator n=1 Tax=Bordetella sp. 15P40C-2 TaxID=2572246 RepID=UPI00132A92D2|nr:LysR family transcriptional regulator [Bordetella sp. 15P40C-2]MVW72245.1 LysR family transcriptional regulator [Bordetella sp. 15P40C-2]
MATDQIAPLVADIYLLTALAETRSFTQTARRLGVSKASVSTRINALEKAVGLPLVRRTTRHVMLTEAGQNLVENAAPAFERIGAGFLAVKDLSDVPRGTVRLTAPVAFGRQHLAPVLPDFLRQYPEVRVDLELVDRLVNLAHEGFDLAIRHTDHPPETYIAWELCGSRSVLVASPEYLRVHGTPQHPRDLSHHACVTYLGNRSYETWSFVREGRRSSAAPIVIPIQTRFRANNSEVLRQAVLGGAGIGMLPDFSAVTSAPGGLVEVLPGWRVHGFFGGKLYALRPWSAHVPQSVKCLVEFLRDKYAQGF